MHRINIASKKARILRIVAYTVTVTLSVITTIILLYIALGYRFDSHSRQITRSGLLLVNSQPAAGTVYIDGKLKDGATPSRFVLKNGSYELSLEQDGYYGWKKQLQIKPSSVKEVFYPWLVPREVKNKTIAEIGSSELFSPSLDRKLVLLHSPNQSLRLLELNPEKPRLTSLTLPASVARESGQVGRFEVIEWALNNKQVLLKQTLPSSAVRIIRLDVGDPEKTITLSPDVSTSRADQLHFVGDNTNQIYSLDEAGVIRRYDVNGENQVILERVRSYSPVGDDRILFSRLSADGTAVESGIWQDKTAIVVDRNSDVNSSELLALGEYEDQTYFAVAASNSAVVKIYRNPLKKPILNKQLTFTTLPTSQPTELSFSPNGRFVMVQSGQSVASYDFDERTKNQFQLNFTPAESSKLSWADGFHLLGFDGKLAAQLLEYDGSNQQTLGSATVLNRWLLSNDNEASYRQANDGDKTVLQIGSLVVEN